MLLNNCFIYFIRIKIYISKSLIYKHVFIFRLLHAQAAYCAFRAAAKTYALAISTITKLENAGYSIANHAALYAEFSVLFYIRSEYDKAYK